MDPHPPTLSTAAVRAVPVRARRERRREQWAAIGPWVLGGTGIVGALLFWQVFAVYGPVDESHFPPPTTVLPVFLANFAYADFWLTVGQTLWAWFLGLMISTVAGVVIGIVIGSSRFLREATHTTIEFLRPIPAVGLIPIAALLFGPRIGAELLIVVYGCFWIILIQVLYGVADVDKVANETVRTMRMSWFQRAWHLVLPTLQPYLMTGIRLGATVALILAISAELVIGTPGLGKAVAQAQLNDNPPAMFALILTAGVLGILVNFVFRFIERKTLFWHGSVRSEANA